MAKSSNIELQRLTTSSLSDIKARVESVESQVTSVQTSIGGSGDLQTTLTDLTTRVNTMLGSGTSRAIEPRAVRRAVRKIQQLETNLNRLMAVS